LIESDLFDPEQLFLTSPADDQVDKIPPSAAAAIHIKKLELIRVSREKNLRAIFPELKAGHSYHFISAGDIDAVSYLTMLIEKCGPFDEFYGSTWTMSRQDCELLDRYLSDHILHRRILRQTRNISLCLPAAGNKQAWRPDKDVQKPLQNPGCA
jgi:hypothetical protein